jgi:hypothetical protein
MPIKNSLLNQAKTIILFFITIPLQVLNIAWVIALNF